MLIINDSRISQAYGANGEDAKRPRAEETREPRRDV
jgi:hypothetical protein